MENTSKYSDVARLHFITQGDTPDEHLRQIEDVLAAGVRWVQLRMKKQPLTVVEETARRALEMTRSAGACLILNDYVEVAARTGADGVHVGKEDMPLAEVLEHMGQTAFVGATANTFEDIQAHARHPLSYVGLGPYRFTRTKEKLSPVLGLEGYRQIVQQMKTAGIQLPVIAIGGIRLDDIPALLQTGVWGIALSSLIAHAPDRKAQARRVLDAIEAALLRSSNHSS
ncbi:thiamine phosphate synthase [Thermonema rossianum]|uniref:thiamine phosphate synthase n=1 Tax=Thermonema rossianum TaxID=55505 RepID=UPI0005718764|nr:thiamine phosphate synthase [Thermonema rossianum]